MLLSRGSKLLQNAVQSTLKRNTVVHKQQVRNFWHGTWNYREPGKPIRQAYIAAEVLGGFAWWWILWHCWHDWHHIVGFQLPEPENWTDAELGIPPDDVDC
ncbi:NADH dehydrogenase [ubiquinone] 1 beta subcomplex subunit 2, mitochondrial-like [Belonocnema kinseyi]|uniref:NADH dehydrogenase [ubiquinone] 1 beta subcomplex subunit 2, mitochondrial-like n=1 Tax=Belonocnema kinseyi TaxID=2817044 RepID=UPI00143DC394|nr:NADH dehydrogenase [ubiquinone] 1 beta subcomplex subunit 2, mitochondrial-like [Belonocnema kinseyi]